MRVMLSKLLYIHYGAGYNIYFIDGKQVCHVAFSFVPLFILIFRYGKKVFKIKWLYVLYYWFCAAAGLSSQ